ncbi:MAG: hypothetical protein RTV72_17580, partial [Candidatus Thorarchaeota archaeon]
MSPKVLRTIADRLFLLSESRGKESSGTAILDEHAIHLLKIPYPASWMIRSDKYQSLVARIIESDYYPKVMIGHSRLVTNGSEADNRNNQPVQKSGVVGIHNGIIVNVDDIWNQFSELDREYEVDTEILLGLLGSKFRETGSIVESAEYAYSLIEGTAAIAALFEGADYLLLATNNGSLYTYSNNPPGLHIFASERFILEQLARSSGLRKILSNCGIIPIKPGSARLINITDSQFTDFSLKPSAQEKESHAPKKHETRKIIDHSPIFRSIDTRFIGVPISRLDTSGDNPKLLFEKSKVFKGLRRCTRCILPETFPFIKFDDEGVCNYCRGYESPKRDLYHLCHGRKALDRFIEPFRNYNEPDCLVMISGGRDSCYALHYMKTVLEMNPVAYTYDWGMVTDLARRKISRKSGKICIENVIVSAVIRKKRSNVR